MTFDINIKIYMIRSHWTDHFSDSCVAGLVARRTNMKDWDSVDVPHRVLLTGAWQVWEPRRSLHETVDVLIVLRWRGREVGGQLLVERPV